MGGGGYLCMMVVCISLLFSLFHSLGASVVM